MMYLRFNNSHSRGLWLAVGYYSPGCPDGGDWAKKGWWRLEPGQAATVLETTNTYATFYAEAEPRLGRRKHHKLAVSGVRLVLEHRVFGRRGRRHETAQLHERLVAVDLHDQPDLSAPPAVALCLTSHRRAQHRPAANDRDRPLTS
jgi:Protein of unknown function (DUF1036)